LRNGSAVCSGTYVFAAYDDVGVVAAYNFMDHKGGVILMCLEIRKDNDITYKPKVF
jgi:hypothetical protein